MSQAPRYIFCTDCDFEQPYPCDYISYKYKLPDASSVLAPVHIGWCTDCGEFVSIQSGLMSATLKGNIKSLESKISDIKRFPLWMISSFMKKQMDSFLFELSQNKKYLSVMGGRNSVHACLKCSGTEVFPVTNNIDTYSHIGCGGNFRYKIDDKGIRLHIEIEDKFIDPVYASDTMILDSSRPYLN